MKKIISLLITTVFYCYATATTIKVTDSKSLQNADAIAKPGDTIELQNGIWNNITIQLTCKGTTEQPIVVKAETIGNVIIARKSKLAITGAHIIIEGLYFLNGEAGSDAVIKFAIKKEVANNCRVTNCVIDNFNNTKRLDDNYWIALYGKNNRVDHCEFKNKKNIGVLIAVILDDERSRENHHSIDHNYFNGRIPLASNGGEIIRVGVSEHCTFSSNTKIENNYFYQCNGETEIISIKSCDNMVKNNVFKECQGAVVLRHGDNNIVSENLFLGNHKKGTGGVRVINKGQWVVNNYFYQCTGENFRSPIAIMNGVPNSPANRYVAVANAVIANNSFVDCNAYQFCVGSDAERSEIPDNVYFFNNLFENKTAKNFFIQYDTLTGYKFFNNHIGKNFTSQKLAGFKNYGVSQNKMGAFYFLKSAGSGAKAIPDSIQALSLKKLGYKLSNKIGFTREEALKKLLAVNQSNIGTNWHSTKGEFGKGFFYNCANEKELIEILNNKQLPTSKTIHLTGSSYYFLQPMVLDGNINFITTTKKPISFSTDVSSLFYLTAGSFVEFSNIDFSVRAHHFITSDTSGNSNHSGLIVSNCSIETNSKSLFNFSKTSVFDNVHIENTIFKNGSGIIIDAAKETDKKGYYNFENLKIDKCTFKNWSGVIAHIARTGNDESTMGPNFIFTNNTLRLVVHTSPLIHLIGVQQSTIQNNRFTECNSLRTIIKYEDVVRAVHLLSNNKLDNAGKIEENKYVIYKK